MKFLKPESVDEALKLKQKEPGSYFIAGGTQINSRFFSGKKESCLISLQKLNLNEIKKGYVGATATMEDIRTSPRCPKGLSLAASHLASRNVRNMATIGGNIASRQSSSDMLPVLISLGAKLLTVGSDGKKEISVLDWLTGSDELILGFKFPYTDKKVFQKKFSRTKNDLPILKASIGYLEEDGRLYSPAMAAGCMGPSVIYLKQASKLLKGSKTNSINTENLFKCAEKELSPIDDQRASAEYRMSLFKSFIQDFMVTLGKQK